MLYLAAMLLVGVGIAHSWLGERYILTRLFRRDNLPPVMGSALATRNILRFGWHLTSIAWWGYAAVLFYMASGQTAGEVFLQVTAAVFGIHGLIILIMSRGRHLAWMVFSAVTVLCLLAAR